MKRFLVLSLALFLTWPSWAEILSGHINIDHNHSTSICWGYAQSRALGKEPGDEECDPRQTYIYSINESVFGSMISGSSLSGISYGDIIVFGQIRGGTAGHAAFVVWVPTPLTSQNRNTIKVDQVPFQGGAEQTDVSLSTVISGQGEPVGYYDVAGFGWVGLTFQNSFGSGNIRPGKDKDGSWLEFPSPITRSYLPYSSLEFMAIDNQPYQGFNRRFKKWKKNGVDDGSSNPRTISVPGSATTFEAVFKKEFDITFRNQFVGISGYPGTIKVNGVTKNSAHLEKVEEDNSVTGEAAWQVYNGIEYTFSQWTDGSSSATRTFSPTNHGTYTANYTGKPRPMTYYNLRVTSSPGQNLKLEWDGHPSPNVDQFQVWRKVKPQGGSEGPPVLKATLSNSARSWTDNEYIMTSGYTDDLLSYDVRAHYSIENTYAAPSYISAFGESNFKMAGEKENISALPESFTVSAFPNPFNPSTTIYYQLPNDAMVVLSIHDLSGRRIALLVEAEKVAGYHTVRWLGTDESNRKVASGMYAYRLLAMPRNGQQVTQHSGKLLLTK